jgi:peptidoglycan/xylan/chitin deacetylase (PgdA/CDA1 family)
MAVYILLYHDLADEGSLISTPATLFAWQMQWLKDQHYPVVALSRVVDAVRQGEPLPPQAVVLTFDDGFESVYSRALPILSRYGFPATVFLISSYYEAQAHGSRQNDWPGQPPQVPLRPMLTWAQIRTMDGEGIAFGAHGRSHSRLDQLPRAGLAVELEESKACLEQGLGRSVELLAYPYGRYSARVRDAARNGYGGACAATPGTVTSRSDRYALPRIDAQYVAAPQVFRQLGQPWFPAYLAARRMMRTSASIVLRRAWR